MGFIGFSFTGALQKPGGANNFFGGAEETVRAFPFTQKKM